MNIYTSVKATSDDKVIFADASTNLATHGFNQQQIEYIKKHTDKKHNIVEINHYSHIVFLCVAPMEKELYKAKEKVRLMAAKLYQKLKYEEIEKLSVIDTIGISELLTAFVEGLLLRRYAFQKYFDKKKQDKNKCRLNEVAIVSKKNVEHLLKEKVNVCKGVFIARDFGNEPPNQLNAVKFAARMADLGKQAGYTTEIFDRRKLEALKFDGLLAVNKGSIDPPTCTIMEWKPANAVNSKPFIFVGKGVTFDTGGISLKSTDNMTEMKADMAGAAAVAGLMYAVAINNLNVYVIGIVPATDNRPSGNAYVPTDVIKMHNGITVEIINTDAEGRIIVADALSYAKKYNPGLVIDIATLTGSAQKTVDKHASIALGETPDKALEVLKESSRQTYERIVELPLWEEYEETLKSNIADTKNLGKGAGAITAAKFLQKFVSYPWVHLDIAGTFFYSSQENYKGNGGSGVGVRLIYDFLKRYYLNTQKNKK